MKWILALALVALVALLAGCTDDAQRLPPGSSDDTSQPTGEGFAPIGQQKSAGNLDTPGVEVSGTMDTCEAGFCIDATASNDGPDSYHTTHGNPDSWSDRLEKDGKVVTHRESGISMPAFSDEAFEPGDVEHVSLAWDGRIEGSDGRMQAAPDGAYTWVLVFHYYDEPAAEGRHTIEVAFDVIVGES